MSEPLVNDIARRVLRLIADAWDIPLDHLSYQRHGPAEMAHHFLRVELIFTYAQVASLLHTYDAAAVLLVKRGEHYYETSPAYQQRYDSVRQQVLNMLELSQPSRAHT